MHSCTRACTTSTKRHGKCLGCSCKRPRQFSQDSSNPRAHAYMQTCTRTHTTSHDCFLVCSSMGVVTAPCSCSGPPRVKPSHRWGQLSWLSGGPPLALAHTALSSFRPTGLLLLYQLTMASTTAPPAASRTHPQYDVARAQFFKCFFW